MNVQSRARPLAFKNAKVFFSGKVLCTDLGLQKVVGFEGEAIPRVEFLAVRSLNLVIETGNTDPSFSIFQVTDDHSQCEQRIGRSSSEYTRMEVGPWSADFDFCGDHPTQARAEGREFGGEHITIGN